MKRYPRVEGRDATEQLLGCWTKAALGQLQLHLQRDARLDQQAFGQLTWRETKTKLQLVQGLLPQLEHARGPLVLLLVGLLIHRAACAGELDERKLQVVGELDWILDLRLAPMVVTSIVLIGAVWVCLGEVL